MPAKKVLFIAFIYPPMSAAGVHRSVRFVRYLPELGWDITVLTPEEKEYPPLTPVDHSLMEKIPASIKEERTRIFQGFFKLFNLKESMAANKDAKKKLVSKFFSSEEKKDKAAPLDPNLIKELAEQANLKKPAPKQKSRFQKLKDLIYDLFTIPDKNVSWLPYAVARGWKLYRQKQVDIIYSTAPPFTDHLIALILKKLTGLPWIADFRDPWARSPMKVDELRGTFRGRAYDYLERKFVENADKVILNTRYAEEEFVQFYGEAFRSKFCVIPNGFDPADFESGEFAPNGKVKGDKLVITHTGALYRKRNPDAFFQAVAEIIDEGIISPEELEVKFVGIIAPDLFKSFKDFEKLENVIRVYPQVSHKEALRFQADSDVLLLFQPGTSLSVPGKFFEYVALKKYMLAVAVPGATTELVEKYELGATATPEDIARIKQGLIDFIERWRNGGIGYVQSTGAYEQYNGRNIARMLSDEMNALL